MWKIISGVAVCWIALSETAHAYLDPGTGTILLQGLIAATATGLYFMRSKIRSLLKHLINKKKSHPEDDDAE